MAFQKMQPVPFNSAMADAKGIASSSWTNWFRAVWNALGGPFTGGQLLSNVAVSTGGTSIAHNLGQTPQVWALCDQQQGATVWRTAWDDKSITLKASATCTVSVWVN